MFLLPGCDFTLKSRKIAGEKNSLPFEPIATDKLACAQDCSDCGQRDAAELFGWDSVPVFEFHLPEDRWEHLQSHALDEVYEQACGYFEGVSIGTVGLRFKGSYGTLYPCINGKGELTCTKLSMKVKFSEIYPDLRFYGLQRLNFHSMIHDPSKMHERLGYDLYREMDIPSPKSSWAVLRVNGTSYGLFSMVEQIDGRFTDNRWPGNSSIRRTRWTAARISNWNLSTAMENFPTVNGSTTASPSLPAAQTCVASKASASWQGRTNFATCASTWKARPTAWPQRALSKAGMSGSMLRQSCLNCI